MTLIDRYLAAVAAQLPRDKREDITAELRDALVERVEAREEALGRALSDDETETLLREFGHPLTVAARYRDGPQSLIGPELFPYWWFGVRAALVIMLGVMIISAVMRSIFGGTDPIQAFAGIWSGLFEGAILIIGVATVAGFILERQPNRPDFMTQWRVKDLDVFRVWSLDGDAIERSLGGGPASDGRAVGRRRKGAGVVATALICVAWWSVFLMWWVGAFELGGLAPADVGAGLAMFVDGAESFGGVGRDEAVRGLIGPLYWPVICYGLFRIGLELSRAAAPGAVRPLAVGDLALAAARGAILVWIWTASVLSPVVRVDTVDQFAARARDLVQGRFDFGHLLTLALVFMMIETAFRALKAVGQMITGQGRASQESGKVHR